MFDGVSLADHTFQTPAMLPFPPRHPSPGSSSSNNDRHLEPPQTYEGLLQANTLLKTRVTELEVINDLYREHSAPQPEIISQDSISQTRHLLEQSLHREESLKHQVEELEREVAELRGEQPAEKRPRISDTTEYPEPPQAFITDGLHS